jgi:hypothetical protein
MSGAVQMAVNLNGPGGYVHWSIFQVSVSNLVLILVMVVIFGAALLFPFPHGRSRGGVAARSDSDGSDGPGRESPSGAAAPGEGAAGASRAGYLAVANGAQAGADDIGHDEDARMWTYRVRGFALNFLPPGKLIPDSQPAYVASWIYVFGVASLAALGVAIVSGFALALGGPDWWHYNPVGHFFNSLHLWSVELFMALLVIHLWGKFWMAAWRGRRAMTWITGVVAFIVSIVECFTGYLSQQNFDSQWISTNGKDAINATGLGSFFDLMNFGQMLMWHIVLVPLVLVAIVGAHILLVRVRGVSHPLPVRPARGRAARRAAAAADAAEWSGPKRRYDLLKEGTVASVVVLILVVVLSGVLSSPDEPPITVQTWAKVAPSDFMATTASELAGTSETAQYGPPYNNGTGNLQRVGVSWQLLAGVRQPVDAASTFVLSPLRKLAATDPAVGRALRRYVAAPAGTQKSWATAYMKAVTKVSFRSGVPSVPAANDGPVPVMVSGELTLAQSGALDADLLAQQPFYGTNYTKPLLFLEDGNYFSSRAHAEHLTGSQWGVMNETGSFPGQPWLWLYTLWYQLPGWRTSANVDLIAIYMTGVATVLLLCVPFLPGLRDIPRLVPVHRLVWRSWNRRDSGGGPGPGTGGGAPGGDGAASRNGLERPSAPAHAFSASADPPS